jgi:UDP-GlcNAc:undecaprenyl-phosphate GlcNAc-1-phosphate transferase
MNHYLAAFATSFLITFAVIPVIIYLAFKFNLVDHPSARSSHTKSTPSLGGIAIFAGIVFSIVLWTPENLYANLKYLLLSLFIIFLIGAKDDIDPVRPWLKIVGEIIASSVVVLLADVKITSFYEVLDIGPISYFGGVLFSIFIILAIINAFNLIDGIDGLSGGLGAVTALFFTIYFFQVQKESLAILSVSLFGAMIAFLYYNKTPSRIFMGDTGSLIQGFICAVLSIEFIQIQGKLVETSFWTGISGPVVAIAVLGVPLFDMLRVIILRIFKRQSIIKPDRNHIHHLLVDMGLTHTRASLILISLQIIMVLAACHLKMLSPSIQILVIFGINMIFVGVVSLISSGYITRVSGNTPL